MKYSKDIKTKILKFKPIKADRYNNLNIDRLVLFGLYYLEQNHIPLYFEYIIVALFKLFPEKFSLVNFTEYPDSFRVNNSVRRLAGSIKTKGATWATGNVENGFALTDTGIEIAEQVNKVLKNPVKQNTKESVKRSRGRSPADDINEIKNSVVYSKWNNKEKITKYDIYSLLGAMPYAPKELLRKHLDYLKNSSVTVKDSGVRDFLKSIEKEFNNIFN